LKWDPIEVCSMSQRGTWGGLTDSQLLAQCDVDTYRASGPGGQKRNKTSSAVRIRHPASGLIVIAEESRSQHENKAKALRRLRQAFFLRLREELPADERTAESLAARPDYQAVREEHGRLHLGRKDPRYWPVVGLVLDVLQAFEARVSEAASALAISTGNLIDFLQSDDKVWEQANQLRSRFGHGPLR
jgi:RF-1 domain